LDGSWPSGVMMNDAAHDPERAAMGINDDRLLKRMSAEFTRSLQHRSSAGVSHPKVFRGPARNASFDTHRDRFARSVTSQATNSALESIKAAMNVTLGAAFVCSVASARRMIKCYKTMRPIAG